jgi:cysteine desulfurase / selenocysteine lyase
MPVKSDSVDPIVVPIDVAAARAATPGCDVPAGSSGSLGVAFLNSAGSSLPTHETLDAVIGHLRRESIVGGYQAADEVIDVLRQSRSDLSSLIGGKPEEVAVMPSDSVGWVKAWWGWVVGGNVPEGSTVLIDRLSYHSHYAALVQTQAITKFTIEVMPSLADGTVDLGSLVIGAHVSVVVLTMIGTHSGNVNPVAQVGSLARSAGVPLFVDGCQALGQLQVDVRQLGCQVFTGTGRKWLRAPRGTGLLWIAEEFIDKFQPPGIDGTNTSWTVEGGLSVNALMGRFEEFEVSIAAQVGLAAAARQAQALGMAAIEGAVTGLADEFRAALTSLPGVEMHDTAAQRCAIVTFSVDGVEPAEVVAAAAENGASINLSSATWAALDMHAKGFTQVVRVSPHYFNTAEELSMVLDAVKHCTKR